MLNMVKKTRYLRPSGMPSLIALSILSLPASMSISPGVSVSTSIWCTCGVFARGRGRGAVDGCGLFGSIWSRAWYPTNRVSSRRQFVPITVLTLLSFSFTLPGSFLLAQFLCTGTKMLEHSAPTSFDPFPTVIADLIRWVVSGHAFDDRLQQMRPMQ